MAASTETPLANSIMSYGFGEQQDAIATVHLSLEMTVLDIDFLYVAEHQMVHPDPAVRDGPHPIMVSKVDCVASQPLQYSYCDNVYQYHTSPGMDDSGLSSSSPFTVLHEDDKGRPLPAFASVTVTKESEDSKLGMGLKKNKDGTYKVSSMQPGCLLSDSPIQVGDTLISVNNRSCANLSGSAVASLLKSTTGWLTVTVEHPNGDPMLVESMIRKETPTSKTGLGVANNSHTHRVKVTSVNPKSAFSSSLLGPRDSILSINGHNCMYMSAEGVAKIIAEAHDNVTVVAKKDMDNAAIVTF